LKKLFVFLVLVLLALHSFGGNKSQEALSFEEKFGKVVELLNSKPKLEKETTKKTEELVKQGEDFLKKKQLKKAKKYFERAIKESEKVYGKYSGFTILICQQIILSCLKNKQYGLAVKYTDKIIDTEHELCFTLPVKASLGVLNNAFMVYALAGANDKFDICLKILEQKIKQISDKEKTQYLSGFYLKLARDCEMLERYDQSVKLLEKALYFVPANSQNIRYEIFVSLVYSNIKIGQYDKAAGTITKAQSLIKSNKLKEKEHKLKELQHLEFFLFFSKSKELTKKRKFAEAQQALDKAKLFLKKIKLPSEYKNFLTAIYRQKALISFKQKDFFSSAKYFKEGFSIYNKFFDSDFSGAAQYYLTLGDCINKQKKLMEYLKAPEVYYKKALKVSRNTKQWDLYAISNYKLGLYYLKNSDKKTSKKHLEEAIRFFRKIPGDKFLKEILDIEAKQKLFILDNN
jgi:tetratricopeptide (TPR) repeat protein